MAGADDAQATVGEFMQALVAETVSLVEIYTVRDGLIVELDVYYKDLSAVAALLAR